MGGKVCIGGKVVDPEAATISVFDRGFLYGDSVYETLRVYRGTPFALEEHLDRLYASGRRVGFELPWTTQHIRDTVDRTRAAAGLRDAYLRIICTRGSGPVSLDPSLALDPQLVVLVLDLPPLPASLYDEGRSVALVSVQRNLQKALDPQAKTGNYMNSVLAIREARAQGAEDAIMLDHSGRVAEASSANVFVLVDGVWCTPPLDVGILSGITRKTILAVCAKHGISAEERVLWPKDLAAAREIFLCSSVREIVPVTKLGDAPVGSGAVGPETKRLLQLYRAEVAART
jgi:branched-chain amino acid aminotransferase